MDNLTATTTNNVEVKWVLTILDHMETWDRMKFKPKKYRYVVIRKGKVTNRFNLLMQ